MADSVRSRVDHGFEGVHLVEHGEEGLEHAVDGEERIRQHDAADDGAGDVAFVPLVAGEPGGHGEVALRMTWKPLTRSQERQFILCGMAQEPIWPLRESFARQFVPGHQAQRLGKSSPGRWRDRSARATTRKSSQRG